MSVEIKGVPELTRQLERKYGKAAMRIKEDRALEKSSDYFVDTLKGEFESFKDTGASIDEMKRTEPYTKATTNQRAILIEWVGPMNRKNIIHLNEHGYTRNGVKYTPKGFAVIAKTLESSKYKYREILKRELVR
ncbi:hypothetical protein [Staphylococcus petrasii]|uniref:hypothetical protein n=1 Tax=Staphylococcus petrasii TaxID=1276936 RepID=UPI001F5A645D|nr:hypothetical protein [Staphylococcus petrasii]MCI2773415.1 hypothetical protein [Staphylococcus petrasii]